MLDFYPFGTTSPVYVTAGGAPVRSASDARYFATWIDRVRAAAEAHPGWNTPAEKQDVLALLAQAHAASKSGPGPEGAAAMGNGLP